MSVYAGPNTIQDGLVLHLDAGNKRSYPGAGLNWFDISEFKRTASLVNGPIFESDAGGCFSLDGTNDYITCPTIGVATANLTMELWIKRKANNGHFLTIDNYDQPELRLRFDTTGLNILYYDDGVYFTNTSYATTFNTNLWYHIVTALQNGSQRYYINGELVLSTSGVYTGNATGNAFENTLGTYNRPSAGYNGYANVKYGIYKVYNRFLSHQQVLNNFNATRARFGI